MLRSRSRANTPPRPRGRGGTSATRRHPGAAPLAASILLAAAVLQLATPGRAAAETPTVAELLRKAAVVGLGRVAAIEELDHGRIRIHELIIDTELKPGGREGSRTLRVLSVADEPGAARVDAGSTGVGFVRPLRRNSYLDAHVPPGAMFQFVERRAGWLQASGPEKLEAIAAPVRQLIESSRKPAPDAATRAAGRRALVFAMLSAPHPLLVANGIADLSTLPELSAALSAEEVHVLSAVVNDPSLPVELRAALIREIGSLGLRAMVEPLQRLQEPALQETNWTALRRLGAPVADEELRDRLRATDPRIRIAAATELLERDSAAAVPLVGPLLRDSDPQVRLGVIEALGATDSPAAVPPLETVFAGSEDVEERQAAARALREIGGDPAIEALHRLAFKGSIDAQRYAVIVLLTLGVSRDDPRVRDIAQRHTDQEIETMLEHGLEAGHAH